MNRILLHFSEVCSPRRFRAFTIKNLFMFRDEPSQRDEREEMVDNFTLSFISNQWRGHGVVWGGNCPPRFSKDGPRDSFKIEEKIAGYSFGKIFPRNGRLMLRN